MATLQLSDPHHGIKEEGTTAARCPLWRQVQEEARNMMKDEPALARYFRMTLLTYDTMERALAYHLACKLGNDSVSMETWDELLADVLEAHTNHLGVFFRADLVAILTRDPAAEGPAHAFLNFKGYLGLQASRIGHVLWKEDRKSLALAIQSRVSEVFGMDIHPGCQVGAGVMIDHATGVVFGETAVVGDNCTFLHGVTLGGTGKSRGDRHPKLGCGILVGAGSMILGNISVGDGCKVAAGSVVLRNLPAQVVAAGVPAKVIGVATEGKPSETVDQNLEHVRYHSKGGNGNGKQNGKSGGSGTGEVGAPEDSRTDPRRETFGMRGIEAKKRSFL
ncbi:unnamed protein product [Ectocarpus sp. 12 AP-2014]